MLTTFFYFGVGTLTSAKDCANAKNARALFGVSPGLNSELITACMHHELPLLRGVMTPSDILNAKAADLHILKFFPAQQAGGVAMLKAFAGPFPDITFCPTGGINLDNAQDYLALKNVCCIGGSWLTPTDAIRTKNWDMIYSLAQQTTQLKKKQA